jgi:hypothetical protein
MTVIAASVVVASRAMAAPAATWTGSFAGFPTSTWKDAWGVSPKASWGFEHMATAADTGVPSGTALAVTYGAGSSAHSCTDCPTTGGGEFYTLFNQIGHADWGNAPTLSLKYQITFPTNYDWGKAGKLPGLFGGEIDQASGGNHGNAWSTRYMWRGGSKGEIYFYSPTDSGYGKDLGLGKWKFAADGAWHAVEQRVDRVKQTITVFYDGKQVFNTKVTGISKIPFSGVFFSTFFGGHESKWGPKKTVRAYYGDFTVTVP